MGLQGSGWWTGVKARQPEKKSSRVPHSRTLIGCKATPCPPLKRQALITAATGAPMSHRGGFHQSGTAVISGFWIRRTSTSGAVPKTFPLGQWSQPHRHEPHDYTGSFACPWSKNHPHPQGWRLVFLTGFPLLQNVLFPSCLRRINADRKWNSSPTATRAFLVILRPFRKSTVVKQLRCRVFLGVGAVALAHFKQQESTACTSRPPQSRLVT